VREIVLDFRRYQALGFSVREAASFARTRLRGRLMLKRHEPRQGPLPRPAQAKR
jgi:hypothetical protein